jgi:predicted nucleotidyltransferase component of viral defense system
MISSDFIEEWRQRAPWPLTEQVEQDLVISRALVDLFNAPKVFDTLAFRGGTALHKLVFDRPHRYSEDIDLVQVESGPLGETMSSIRDALQWLGKPKWKQTDGRVTFVFRFDSETTPPRPMKLKVEINTREAGAKLGFKSLPFAVDGRWFAGKTTLRTFSDEELLATKLRALYQRRKGRDLFDLWIALRDRKLELPLLLEAFHHYMGLSGAKVSRAEFEANMHHKMNDATFRTDITPLLVPGDSFDADVAFSEVHRVLIAQLPGAAWKKPEEPVDEA